MTMAEWDQIGSIIEHGATVLAVLVGSAWAAMHFWLRRDLSAKLDQEISVEFLGLQGDEILVQVEVALSNSGAVRHTLTDINYRLRTLNQEDTVASDPEKHLGQVQFPHAIVRERRFFPEAWEYSYVEPGVTNHYRSITTIPRDASFVLASSRLVFEDKRSDFHQPQRAFAVPADIRAQAGAVQSM